MGKPYFSKVFRYVGIATIGLVVAITTAFFLANPVSAHSHEEGGGNPDSAYSWDTDNLRFSGYSARNFRVPFHNYEGYVERVEAKPCITYNSFSGTSVLSASSFSGSCASPAVPLNRVCAHSYSRYVSSTGSKALPSEVTARPAAYGSWASKGTGYGLFGTRTGRSSSFYGAYSPSGTGQQGLCGLLRSMLLSSCHRVGNGRGFLMSDIAPEMISDFLDPVHCPSINSCF